eukprot:783187-Prymnesium_polylepis.1
MSPVWEQVGEAPSTTRLHTRAAAPRSANIRLQGGPNGPRDERNHEQFTAVEVREFHLVSKPICNPVKSSRTPGRLRGWPTP